jgi:hypothetical protein
VAERDQIDALADEYNRELFGWPPGTERRGDRRAGVALRPQRHPVVRRHQPISVRWASSEMLVTPNFVIAPAARSETNWY